MDTPATLEQVDELVARLSPEDQKELVTRINDRLCEAHPDENGHKPMTENQRRLSEFLKLCQEKAIRPKFTEDAVETLRQIREERMSRF